MKIQCAVANVANATNVPEAEIIKFFAEKNEKN